MVCIAGIQLRVTRENQDENLEKAESWIKKAADEGAELICLPEYFSSGNFITEPNKDFFLLAEEEDGKTVSRMAALAQKLKVCIITPIFEKDSKVAGRFYNSAVILDMDGNIYGKYRKQFIPLGNYFEKYYFAPGNMGTPVFQLNGITFGIIICFDRHFFELSRTLCLKGAEIIFIPSSTFRIPSIANVWQSEITTIAAVNSLFVLGINTTGYEDGIDQIGMSIFANPFGGIISALEEQEGMVIADIRPETVMQARLSNPIIRNYRFDTLKELMDLYYFSPIRK